MDETLTAPLSREAVREAREELCHAFPAAIAPKGWDKRPLKIGIHKDMTSYGMEPALIAAALRDYTGGFKYLKALTPDADRIDIEGAPAGKVTADQAAYAQQQIKRMRRKSHNKQERKEFNRAVAKEKAQ